MDYGLDKSVFSFYNKIYICGCSSSVERQLPKLHRWVRLPSSAPNQNPRMVGGFSFSSDMVRVLTVTHMPWRYPNTPHRYAQKPLDATQEKACCIISTKPLRPSRHSTVVRQRAATARVRNASTPAIAFILLPTLEKQLAAHNRRSNHLPTRLLHRLSPCEVIAQPSVSFPTAAVFYLK